MLRESFEAARSLPENQKPVKAFALQEAWRILMDAYVVDPTEGVLKLPVTSSNRRETIEISGSALKAIRKEQDLSQRGLIHLMQGGITPGYLSTIERRDPSRVSRATAIRLAAALGKDIKDIIFKNDS